MFSYICVTNIYLSFLMLRDRKNRLTVLVEQHPDGYSAHVETVQKILDVLADDWIRPIRLLVLHDSLSHGGNHVIVSIPDLYDRICETKWRRCQLSQIEDLKPKCILSF